LPGALGVTEQKSETTIGGFQPHDATRKYRRPVKPSAEVLAKALRPADVAACVLAVASLPTRVCVPEMQVVPTGL
jgi:NADP-dependent 3-hydroxy acid dehydrogenase YdfG